MSAPLRAEAPAATPTSPAARAPQPIAAPQAVPFQAPNTIRQTAPVSQAPPPQISTSSVTPYSGTPSQPAASATASPAAAAPAQPAAGAPQTVPSVPMSQPAPAAATTATPGPASAPGSDASTTAGAPTSGTIDFEDPDASIDISDALRSKQYVHRAILSNAIRTTSRFNAGSFYINQLLGFSSVWQRKAPLTKYTTGLMGFSTGYITSGGHALELGLELSAVSNIYGGYKYYYRMQKLSLWPFAGAGVGTAMKSLNFADGPQASNMYTGSNSMGYFTFGLLIPLVDVGLKAEARLNFYGGDRWVLTEGIGAILFL